MARPLNRQRKIERLVSGTAVAVALLYATGAAEVVAQITNDAFQGAPSAGPGVTVNRSYWRDEISTTAQTGVVTWTPYDTTGTGPINFMPQGRTGEFYGPAGFTILNVVLPSNTGRAISLNGLVNTRIGSVNGPVGGNVWFYSPGGIIVGGTARFNVGGLLLSAAAIPTTAGTFNPNTVNFSATAGSTSAIQIDARTGTTPGPQIQAADYIALIAPRIVQSGTLRADGQIAFIAAEAGTLTMPVGGGLFSIAVSTGTSATGDVIDHQGTTGGTSSSNAATDPRRIYMVTASANQAVTMLLEGNVGFDYATSATFDGNAVVLSAGRPIVAGQIQHASNPVGVPSNIQIGQAGSTTISSNLIADASGSAAVNAFDGTVYFDGDVTLIGDNLAALRTFDPAPLVDAGSGFISVSGNATVVSARSDRTAGTALVSASRNGSIDVGGALTVRASGDAALRGGAGSANAVGGTATIQSSGAEIRTRGAVLVDASAEAGLGGTATGGTANITLSQGGGLTSEDSISAIALAVGGGSSGTGGSATGGNVNVTTSANSYIYVGASLATFAFVPVDGAITMSADATGGAGLVGGLGQGGRVTFEQSSEAQSVAESAVLLSANGTGGATIGGAGGLGGAGRGGNVSMVMNAGVPEPSTFATLLQIAANGTGGSVICSSLCAGGAGGAGTGGTATLAFNGGSLAVQTLSLTANGLGGAGGNAALSGNNGGAGGAGLGGIADVSIAANGFYPTLFSVAANGTGGAGGSSSVGTSGGDGGTGNGGTAGLTVSSTGAFARQQIPITVSANASGGRGGDSNSGAGGRGGDALGAGVSNLTISSGGILPASAVLIEAVSFGGQGGNHLGTGTPDTRGGDATGGAANIAVDDGQLNSTSITADARAYGGSGGTGPDGSQGIGGNGVGGRAAMSVLADGSVATSQLRIEGSASGNFASTNRVGGSGTGGSASLLIDGGSVDVTGGSANLFEVRADGFGGDGQDTGGAGNGGPSNGASLTLVNSGTLEVADTSVIVSALGYGGVGDVSGGAAVGGIANATLSTSSSLTVSGAETGLIVTSVATGGDAATTGGSATGGSSALVLNSGTIDADSVQVVADALGGGSLGYADGSSGAATGGIAELTLGNGEGAVGSLAQLNTGALLVGASAQGGSTITLNCGEGGCPLPYGTPGGDGQGGTASAILYQGAISAGAFDVLATGTGGHGLDGVRSAPSASPLDGGAGGNGTGGSASILLAGASFEGPAITLNADGLGGDGGGSLTSFLGVPTQTGGDGGSGRGGTAEFVATSGSLSGPSLDVHAIGTGGAGGRTQTIDPPPSGGQSSGAALSGGDGGAGEGGNARIATSGTGSISFTTLIADASGIGGDGGAHSGTRVPNVSGSGTGGTAEITAAGGSISAINASIRAEGQFGQPGASPAGFGSFVGNASGGTTRLVATGAPITIEDQLLMSSDGSFNGGAVEMGVADGGSLPGTLTLGAVELYASGGNHGSIAIDNASAAPSPSITMTSLNAYSYGAVAGDPPPGFLHDASAGNRTVVNGPANINSGGAVVFAATGAGGFTATDALNVVTSGATTVRHTGNTGAAPTVRGASVDIETGSFEGLPGSIVLGDTTLAINATSGSIVASILRATSSTVTLNATGDVTVNDDISSGTGVTARGNNVTLNARGNLLATLIDARAGDATVIAAGNLDAVDTHASRNIVLTSSGQAVTVGRATADTGSATLTGNTSAVVNGPVTAATRIDTRAGQIAVNGTMRAADIAFDSAGIAVSSGAQVGFTGTTRTVTFTNRAGATSIGGAEAQSGYSLSGAEIARVESDSIRVVAPGAASIGALTLRGANAASGGLTNLTANGLFEVQAAGDIAVNAALAVNGAASGTRLALRGANVGVTTPGASIAILDSASAPTGVLTLAGGRVTVATSSVAGALASAANVDARDTLLGDLGGPTSEGGFITAGQLVFNISNGLYIQNSGLDTPFDDRRGFTAGAGGITINNTGSSPAEVVINGRQANATGGFILGTDLDDVITFTGGAITQGSTVNGCEIGQLCRINAADADLDPIQDVAGFLGTATGQISLEIPLVELSELNLYSFAPPIEDPITAAGNEDLWIVSEPCGVDGKPPCPR